MSFDLYFCVPPSKQPPDAAALQEFLATIDGVRIESFEAGPQALFENEVTGVYCVFDLFDQGNDTPIPSNMVAVPLAFNLNFIRPSFFAREAMPLVASIAERFGLLIIDPQSDETPAARTSEELILSWERSNERSVSTLMTGHPDLREQTGYLPRRSADEWWAYASRKTAVERALADEDIYVPTVFVFREQGRREVMRAISWPEEVDRMLVPAFDGFILGRAKQRRLRKPEQETRFVVAGIEDDDFAPALEPHPLVPEILQLTPVRERVQQAFTALWERSVPLDERFERVRPDGFVDVNA